ncbi:MAG: glycosyltransferase family 2 protein [Candidatus Tectimicrobiota bacterium]
MSRYIAVIPVYNEATTIARVVAAARAYLPVIVVDDASTDGSGTRAAAAGALLITLPGHAGKGEALRRGFTEALRRGAEAVLTLDGDGQHDPEDIPCFLAASQQWPGSLVIGGRLESASVIPPARCQAIQVVSFWINWLGQCYIQDSQSGFRLYPAAMLRTLAPRHGQFLFESELLLKAVQAGWRVHELPIRTLYPPGRVSHYSPLRDGLAITLYLLLQGIRGWPVQLWHCYRTWRSGDCMLWRQARQRLGVACLATLGLPLLCCGVLLSLWAGQRGRALLSLIIRRLYDSHLLLASLPGRIEVSHEQYQRKHWEFV